jgi:hypothetical protein
MTTPSMVKFPRIGMAVYTAAVSPPDSALGTFTGNLRVLVAIHVGGEQGVVSFPFVYTGQPPARFTGAAREDVEDGSLAIYLGVQVSRPGRYVAVGRLYDSRGQAIAILHFNDVLTEQVRELRLLAFGTRTAETLFTATSPPATS